MDGPRAGVDPDQVEEDVMGYYRNIYKLEKQFDKEPNPKNIAIKVSIRFMEYYALDKMYWGLRRYRFSRYKNTLRRSLASVASAVAYM